MAIQPMSELLILTQSLGLKSASYRYIWVFFLTSNDKVVNFDTLKGYVF